MAKSKLVNVNKKIAEEVVQGYKKIEDNVVSGYHRIEDRTVQGYQKIADTFVDQFLTKDGESIEEAQIRLTKEQQLRKEENERKAGKLS